MFSSNAKRAAHIFIYSINILAIYLNGLLLLLLVALFQFNNAKWANYFRFVLQQQCLLYCGW